MTTQETNRDKGITGVACLLGAISGGLGVTFGTDISSPQPATVLGWLAQHSWSVVTASLSIILLSLSISLLSPLSLSYLFSSTFPVQLITVILAGPGPGGCSQYFSVIILQGIRVLGPLPARPAGHRPGLRPGGVQQGGGRVQLRHRHLRHLRPGRDGGCLHQWQP